MAFTTAAAVSAQTPDRDALRARQETLFEALSADPTNLDLMFSYAVASMRLEDYEPAIATFERMLIFNPDLPRVRLELGVAYYRLGVYEAARYQFEQALAADPPETVVARIEPFLDEIENRTARNAFGGFVSVGALYSSNANLGPEDRQILVAGLPGGVGTIAEEDAPSSDYGLRVTGSLRHRYDLRRPRDDAWISTLGYAGLRYRAESDGDLDALTATTGPRLSLDDEAFGLKARPYLGGGFVRSGGEVLYLEGGAGVELSEVVSPEWSLFGVGTAFWRDFRDNDPGDEDFEGFYGTVVAGATHDAGGGRSLRGSAIFATDLTRSDATTNVELGLRLSATQRFEMDRFEGFERFDLPWRATVFAQASRRMFDAPDPEVDPGTTRRDVDARLGARLVAPIGLESAIAADVSYFERFSNLRNYDLDNLEFGLSFVRYF